MNKLRITVFILAMGICPVLLLGQNRPLPDKLTDRSDENTAFWKEFRWLRADHIMEKSVADEDLTEAETFSWDGDVWVPSSLTNYEYDSGQIVTIDNSYHDGQSYLLQMRNIFIYSNGRLAENVMQVLNFFTMELENNFRTLNSYTESGGNILLSQIIEEEWQNETWVPVYQENYTFDNGVITSGISYEYVNGTPEERDRFTVTVSNDTTYITTDVRDAGEWVPIEREIYPGYTPAELFDYFTKTLDEIYTMMFSVSLISIDYPDYILQVYSNGGWDNEEAQVTSKVYANPSDPSTLILISKDYDVWNGTWVTEEIEEIHYNQKSVPDSSLFKMFMESEFVPYYRDIYTYDEGMHLTEILTSFDSGAGFQNYIRHELRYGGSSTSVEEPEEVITRFELEPAYPNPFNPVTNITYRIAETGKVSISVFDVVGREVADLYNGVQNAGRHTLQFDAGNLSSGTYFVVMRGANYYRVSGITLIK
ncbi:T9SS type A sorting domain-containing protein [Balneola sp. MJW-20]|uniref:T9SS type A sorting domain-containing protein n=1 Tax=Gracilimonas aurantiaca TaxID=3234185 RepID=UPI003464FFBA